MAQQGLEETSSCRLKKTTIKSLKALRRPELDETIEDVVERLITFYLKKPDESRKRIGGKKKQ